MVDQAARFDRLPVWARQEIALLRRRVEEGKARNAELIRSFGLEPDDDTRLGLTAPDGMRIKFGDFTVFKDKGVLDIHNGWGGISVRPIVSNHIEIANRGY